jgi:hypothetical protein
MFNEAAQNASCARQRAAGSHGRPAQWEADRAQRVVDAERKGDELNRAIRQRSMW